MSHQASCNISPLVGIACHGVNGIVWTAEGAASRTSDVKVNKVVLENGRGARAELSNFGATLMGFYVTSVGDSEATCVNVNLDQTQLPCRYGTYQGVTCGRVANRVALGKFQIDENSYELAVNNGPNSLHGGPGGFHAVAWKIVESGVADRGKPVREEAFVVFEYQSPAKEEGYPGTLIVRARYALGKSADGKGDELRFAFTARLIDSAVPTIVNICNHAYWNLSGKPGASIGDHLLELACPSYLPVDSTSIPTGVVATVENTPFDFCSSKARLGERIELVGKDLSPETYGIDHCLCRTAPDGTDTRNILEHKDELEKSLLREFGQFGKANMAMIADLRHPASGRGMTVFTTQPGVQVYTGNFMPEKHRRTGICLETQHFPDAINQEKSNDKFQGTILKPGEEYFQATVHAFFDFEAIVEPDTKRSKK